MSRAEKKYNLPLSTPKGSDLDYLLNELIEGIETGLLKRTSFEAIRDNDYPEAYEIRIEFRTQTRKLSNPDVMRRH